jgi:hypothetical protein
MAQGQGKTMTGQGKTLFGAKVSSWAKLDGSGKVLEAGVTLPLSAIEKAPLPGPADKPPAEGSADMRPEVILEFPEAVKKTTSLDHLELWWEGFGHPPERYLAPHFDFHFFGIPASEVTKINCKNLTPPALELTPKGYAPAVPPGANPAEFCVPLMGFHALPLSEFAAPGQLKPGLFDHVLISGFYGGKYIFTEPMITREFLLKKQNINLEVSRPAKVGRKTLYPTRFQAIFDAKANAYQFVYSGFEMGE